MEAQWLDWARRLQAISQNGLEYAANPFDRERYEAVRRVAAEIMAAGAGVILEPVLNLFMHESGYATPKVDVRGVVFQNDALLLVKERADNAWTLPGGWAEPGLSPRENVVKEVLEESGYETRVVQLLAVYDRTRHPHRPPLPFHIYKFFFRCEITGGRPVPSVETADVGFFREGEIPPLSVMRVTPQQIARMFDHHRHPEWPPDCD
ncbi:MAG: NUDIX hydrolase [bacterium]